MAAGAASGVESADMDEAQKPSAKAAESNRSAKGAGEKKEASAPSVGTVPAADSKKRGAKPKRARKSSKKNKDKASAIEESEEGENDEAPSPKEVAGDKVGRFEAPEARQKADEDAAPTNLATRLAAPALNACLASHLTELGFTAAMAVPLRIIATDGAVTAVRLEGGLPDAACAVTLLLGAATDKATQQMSLNVTPGGD